jgi:hypothetical protein
VQHYNGWPRAADAGVDRDTAGFYLPDTHAGGKGMNHERNAPLL